MVNVFSPKIASESTQQTCKRARSSGCTLEATEGAILLPLHFFSAHTAPINIAQSSGYHEIRAFFPSSAIPNSFAVMDIQPHFLVKNRQFINKKEKYQPKNLQESLAGYRTFLFAEPCDTCFLQSTSCLEPPQGSRLWEEISQQGCIYLIGCMTSMPSSPATYVSVFTRCNQQTRTESTHSLL